VVAARRRLTKSFRRYDLVEVQDGGKTEGNIHDQIRSRPQDHDKESCDPVLYV